MTRKCTAWLLILCMVFAQSALVSAADLQTVYVDEKLWTESFKEFTTNISGFETVADPTEGTAENSVLKLESEARSGAQNFTANLDAGTSLAVSYRLLCTPDADGDRLWYMQLLKGKVLALEIECWSSVRNDGFYQFRINKKPVTDYDAFRYDSFNDVQFQIDAAENTITICINEDEPIVKSYADLGLTEVDVEAGMTTVRIYSYDFGVKPIYFDDLCVSYKKRVEFDPDELRLTYQSPEIVYGENSRTILTEAATSLYLQQKAYLKLVSRDVPPKENLTFETQACQMESGAVFSFDEALPDTVCGWYGVTVDSDYITSPEEERTERLYIATSAELQDLPGDFSLLPADLTEAMKQVEGYLPILVSEKMDFAKENLAFLTKYFQSCTEGFQTVKEVQEAYKAAVFYLDLSAAEGQELKQILEENGFLEIYEGDSALSEHETEFLQHFETKRTEGELLSDGQIAAALRYACAMTKLNHAKRSEIAKIVSGYNDIFELEIDSERVKALNEDDLYTALYAKSYTNVAAVKTDWTNRIVQLEAEREEAEQEKEKEEKKGSGGGGSGGGSYESREAAAPPQIAPLDKEETTKPEMFFDIEGHWARQAIMNLHERGIVSGYADGGFHPDEPLTRAEFAAMLVRAVPTVTGEKEVSFADVSESDWFFPFIKIASGAGIIQGADGLFMPDSAITREQLAVMIYRTLKPGADLAEIPFSDRTDISAYALEAVSYLTAQGYLSGYEDDTLRPRAYTSRAETAKLLSAMLAEIAE